MPDLLEPLEFETKTLAGGTKTYVLSKFPCIPGREIISKYPLSALPRVGDYAVNEQTMLKLMSYVAVPTANGSMLRLSTAELVNNHVPDWETLARIEVEMLKYNTSFFGRVEILGVLETLTKRYLVSISPMLKGLLLQLSQVIKQASNNSKQNTP